MLKQKKKNASDDNMTFVIELFTMISRQLSLLRTYSAVWYSCCRVRHKITYCTNKRSLDGNRDYRRGIRGGGRERGGGQKGIVYNTSSPFLSLGFFLFLFKSTVYLVGRM